MADSHESHVRMVDVGEKPVTARTATASARVTLAADVFDAVIAGRVPKGDVLTTARIAGIMAAKRTPDLLPLCHPLPIDGVEVEVRPEPPDAIQILATVRTQARTGVEMEALTAASVAALTVYDMCKSLQKSIGIGPIRLEHKAGGRSGEYERTAP